MLAITAIRTRDEALAALDMEQRKELENELALLGKLGNKRFGQGIQENAVVGPAIQEAVLKVRRAMQR